MVAEFHSFTANYQRQAIGPAKFQTYVEYTGKEIPDMVEKVVQAEQKAFAERERQLKLRIEGLQKEKSELKAHCEETEMVVEKHKN